MLDLDQVGVSTLLRRISTHFMKDFKGLLNAKEGDRPRDFKIFGPAIVKWHEKTLVLGFFVSLFIIFIEVRTTISFIGVC